MNNTLLKLCQMSRPDPIILALFQKRIDGDDALLHLASLRFKEACLGTELYAKTPDELDWLLRFKPARETPSVIHMHRGVNILEEGSRKLIMDFASCVKEQVFGLVIHDQVEIATRPGEYLAAVREIESGLKGLEGSPYVLIEYAVGLDPEIFLKLFERTHDLERVSACVDIGHIGIWQTRDTYSRNHPGEDVCALTPYDPRLLNVINDVEVAVNSALPTVLDVIKGLGNLKKHVHFHLHDGHPLSTFSSFGISDHMSFLDEIPIPFEYKGERTLHPMFGPSGLSRIVTESLRSFGDRISFTLEIHPSEGRLPLGGTSYLFNHWEDKTNAERMNYWLSVILKNHKLLLKACKNDIGDKSHETTRKDDHL